MNSFGTSSRGFPLYDPRAVRENRYRFRREALPALERATSLYVPSGRWPSRGWVLLAREDYDNLGKYSTSLQLELGNPAVQHNVGTLRNLSIVQAQCVTRGVEADEKALYLVEVTDGRGVLCNQWQQHPLVNWYNIRTPGYPQTFFLDSMNDYAPAGAGSKTTWTWASMLQDIWDRMGDLLGPWPGLPTTPLGTPEGFWFPGVSAWEAMCSVLDHLGLTVAVDLTSSTPYTIVQPGAADSDFDNLSNTYKSRLEDDLEWIDVGAARVPRRVDVLFRRRNSIYGTEETVRYDSFQWSTEPSYSISVDAPSDFADAVGTHYLWSDFTIRYDVDGNPLGTDVALATSIAQEQVQEYFAVIYRQTLGYMTRTYAGALPFATGSRVDGVCWYQDYRQGLADDRQGWRTQIVRGRQPPWPRLTEEY